VVSLLFFLDMIFANYLQFYDVSLTFKTAKQLLVFINVVDSITCSLLLQRSNCYFLS